MGLLSKTHLVANIAWQSYVGFLLLLGVTNKAVN